MGDNVNRTVISSVKTRVDLLQIVHSLGQELCWVGACVEGVGLLRQYNINEVVISNMEWILYLFDQRQRRVNIFNDFDQFADTEILSQIVFFFFFFRYKCRAAFSAA